MEEAAIYFKNKISDFNSVNKNKRWIHLKHKESIMAINSRLHCIEKKFHALMPILIFRSHVFPSELRFTGFKFESSTGRLHLQLRASLIKNII